MLLRRCKRREGESTLREVGDCFIVGEVIVVVVGVVVVVVVDVVVVEVGVAVLPAVVPRLCSCGRDWWLCCR